MNNFEDIDRGYLDGQVGPHHEYRFLTKGREGRYFFEEALTDSALQKLRGGGVDVRAVRFIPEGGKLGNRVHTHNLDGQWTPRGEEPRVDVVGQGDGIGLLRR